MFSRRFRSEMKFLDWFLILLSLLTAKERLLSLFDGEDELVTGGFQLVGSRWLDENIKYKVNNNEHLTTNKYFQNINI